MIYNTCQQQRGNNTKNKEGGKIMNYELLKKISKNLYINFQTLRNNIKDQDLNINMSFRATAEELMFQINNIYKFIPDGEKFYNRIINNQQFQIHMLNNYRFDRKF